MLSPSRPADRVGEPHSVPDCTKRICLRPAKLNPNVSNFLRRAAPLTTYHHVQHGDEMVNSIDRTKQCHVRIKYTRTFQIFMGIFTSACAPGTNSLFSVCKGQRANLSVFFPAIACSLAIHSQSATVLTKTSFKFMAVKPMMSI